VNTTEARKTVRELMTSQRFTALGTAEGGKPYLSLVAFAATTDLKRIIFPTRRATRKYRNLVRQPEVAMLVDARPGGSTAIGTAPAVTALGKAREASAPQASRLRAAFLRKHPELRQFVEAPDCALFVVRVRVYNGVMALDRTFSLRP